MKQAIAPSRAEASDFSVDIGKRPLFRVASFAVRAGSSVAIVGRTGSGKSVFLRSVAGLLPVRGPFATGGDLTVLGEKVYANGRKAGWNTWSSVRKAGLVFVPAESAQAMNPSFTLEQNVRNLSGDAAPLVAERLAGYFGIDFAAFARLYPDEASGGELQRITLMTLLSRPGSLVLLDEPTVNLDRDLRGRFVDFLNEEVLADPERTVLIASHDIDFVRALELDAAYALQEGDLRPLEALPAAAGFDLPLPYEPSGEGIELEGLSQSYVARGVFGEKKAYAFRNLGLRFDRSKVYGVTGPSGCGKSSMIKAILRLVDGTTGSVRMEGMDLVALKPREDGADPRAFKPFRRRMGVVQQDSRFAFLPHLRIRDSIARIFAARGEKTDWDKLAAWMAKAGLPEGLLDAKPRTLSSGEMKRMDIARALAAEPDVLLLDEPFAYIDFETRAAVMKAISGYLAERDAVLVVVTHEDFDLRAFVQEEVVFLEAAAI